MALGTSTPTSITVVEMSTCERPERNSSIRRSFSAGRIRPWSTSTLRSGNTSVARRFASASAARTSLLFPSSIAAQTTNAWRPASHLLANELVGLGAFGVRASHARFDLAPALRHLVEDGHVEITVVSQCQGPRDRRRRHDEDVRFAALALQRHPLVHAEPMLLVDHGKREIVEGDALLHQSVGPDDEVDLPSCDRLQHPSSILAGHRGSQQRERERGRLPCARARRGPAERGPILPGGVGIAEQ